MLIETQSIHRMQQEFVSDGTTDVHIQKPTYNL